MMLIRGKYGAIVQTTRDQESAIRKNKQTTR